MSNSADPEERRTKIALFRYTLILPTESRLMGFQLGQKSWNRGTGCGSSARPGLWGGGR